MKKNISKKIHIRKFIKDDSDYKAIIAIHNAIWPDYPSTIEEWKHSDNTRDPKYLYQRLVAELEKKIIGFGCYCQSYWSYKPEKYEIEIYVHPDFQHQGIGTLFYNYLINALSKYTPEILSSDTREDKIDSVRFLTKRGFKQVMREPTSYLDIVKFEPAEFPGITAKMDKLGIKIKSIAEIKTFDKDWKHKYWDLEWELLQDVPSPDPLTRQTFENFVKRTLGSPSFLPEANFISLDKSQWIGMSALWKSQAEPEKLYTGLTGIVRSHRRKKIATAMKIHAIQFAKHYGAKIIETDNEENNPMYFLNLKLGFKSKPAWLEFMKNIKETHHKNKKNNY